MNIETSRRVKRGNISAIRMAVVGIMTAGLVSAHPKISHNLENLIPGSTVDVIVQFKSNPTNANHDRVIAHGGLLKSRLDIVRGGSYRINAGKLVEVAG